MNIYKHCSVKDCEIKSYARGYCVKHYYTLYRNHDKQPLYARWQNIIRRCHYENHPRYADWGGRGIKVCDRWRNSYADFEMDMLPTFQKGLTLDRKDNNGDYEPSNVHWVTMLEQSKNKRTYPKNRKSRVLKVL